jgi:hypothetical protein
MDVVADIRPLAVGDGLHTNALDGVLRMLSIHCRTAPTFCVRPTSRELHDLFLGLDRA